MIENQNNKVVLITGAGKGIGRAIAEKFLEEGFIVYGTYNASKDKMLELEQRYMDDNKESRFKILGPYDFTNLDDTEQLIKELSDVEFDSVVCNAGMFSENDDFLNFDLDEFNKTMNCNFYTPMILCIKLQNKIKNFGSIVIMSSNDAYSGAYASLSYSVSKAALISLNKCLCVNFGRRGIRVNSVAPGAINTDMNTPEQEFDAPLYTPIGRIGQPKEVAEVVYFLSSDKSSFINGENVTIDGGYSDVSILLKNEVGRLREFKGYEECEEIYKKMKKGNTLLHIDCCLPHAWADSDYEREWIKQNKLADNRGANIKRILMINKKDEARMKNNPMIKLLLDDVKNLEMYAVRKKDVMEKCKESYNLVNDGFGVFNKEIAFIDSFSDLNSIGYVITGDILINPLIDSFETIWNNIENGTIPQFEIFGK